VAAALGGAPLGTPDEAGRGPWGSRWHVRTSSIGETVQALSRIWGEVAAVASEAELDEKTRTEVRGDPRLGSRIAPEREIRVRTRTSVLTLVVVAPQPEVQERVTAAIAALAARHPSRAVILAPADPHGPSSFDAHVYAACTLPERGSAEVCTEAILIQLGGELGQHLASTLAQLCIHDLPVVLWWPDDVPFGGPVFVDLAPHVDRLLVDSGAFRDDGLERLDGMARVVRDGLVVHDVSWMRLMLWRELVASCFDHPLLRPELRNVRHVRVDFARPGGNSQLARAALFTGWLMSMLRWTVAAPMRPEDDGTWSGTLRGGRREIGVSFHPVSVEYSGPVRAPGSLVRVELSAGRNASATRVRVTRQSDHLLATADWNGAQVIRRATRLEAFEDMPFLAEALDRTSHDRVFALALEHASTLVASPPRADAGAGA
jgi:glucose-6-phosphate dehydrogenase assembly protein OpcA